MGTVKYTDDCTTISSTVLSEVLRYGQVQKPAQPPLTIVSPIESFQPLGSSLPQMESPKSSKGFSLTRRLPESPNTIVHQYNLSPAIGWEFDCMR